MNARPEVTGKSTLYLAFDDLEAHGVPYGRQRIYELMRANLFPQAIKYGNHRNSPVRWLAAEIDAWVLERVRARPVVVKEPEPEKPKKRRRRAAA
jgi:predicted DNA-binding transcriptional regulator AlpA